MADEPIEPRDYISGVSVVDIGDIRIARGLTRRPHSVCTHRHMVYDQQERRIWCKDCEKDVEPFDAFVYLVASYDGAVDRLEARQKALAEAERFQVRSLAAKAVDQAWRSHRSVPACPHCKKGLLPEHFKNGVRHHVSRELAEQQAKKEGK